MRSAGSALSLVVALATLAGACAGGRGGGAPAADAPAAAKPAAPAPSCAADRLGPLDSAKMYRDCRGAADECREACERDDVEACFGLAIVEQEREMAAGVEDAELAAASNALYRKACRLGAPNACTNHAAHLWRFSEQREDLACAARLFEATCEVDDHFGCGMAARILVDHAPAPEHEDVAHARALLERSCAQLGGFPCHVLALYLERGAFGPVPDGRIDALMQQACDGGDDKACGEYASVEETFGP